MRGVPNSFFGTFINVVKQIDFYRIIIRPATEQKKKKKKIILMNFSRN